MKLFAITLLMALFAIGYSSESYGLNQTDPAHPGKCVTNGLVLSPGETGKPEGFCMRVICEDADGSVRYQHCFHTITAPPCTVGNTKYPDELYPKCCEKEIICPEGVKPIKTKKIG